MARRKDRSKDTVPHDRGYHADPIPAPMPNDASNSNSQLDEARRRAETLRSEADELIASSISLRRNSQQLRNRLRAALAARGRDQSADRVA